MKKTFKTGDATVDVKITMLESDMRPMADKTIYHCHADCTFSVPDDRFPPFSFPADAYGHVKEDAICGVFNMVSSILAVKEEAYRAYVARLDAEEKKRSSAQILQLNNNIQRI